MTKKVRYFEDLSAGDRFEIGSFTLSEEEIISFAERYDPQPFHVDAAAAADTMFGGLIASGWQTAACVMRLMVDGFISVESSLGSPGMDELRWLRPVRPNVSYAATIEITESRPSRSKPDRGTVWSVVQVTDPEGEVVYTSKGMGIYLKRPPQA